MISYNYILQVGVMVEDSGREGGFKSTEVIANDTKCKTNSADKINNRAKQCFPSEPSTSKLLNNNNQVPHPRTRRT
jgi:hypothetical protein